MKQLKIFAASVCLALWGSIASASTFGISVNYTGNAIYESFFLDAVSEVTSFVTGRQTPVELGDLVISASVLTIDGAGGILGQASPTQGAITGGFTYATQGFMEFDAADVGSLVNAGTFDDVVLHEMLHVIGLGPLWVANGVYVNGTGQYTGAAGLAAYQAEFNPAASFIPVDTTSGPGTANLHWDEDLFENDPATFSDEIMTGFLNGPTYISETTRQSFIDIGYEVASASVAPVPLPASGGGALLGLGALVWFRFRPRQRGPHPRQC